MKKRTLGPKPLVFPMPAVLVGSWREDGRADAMTAAWAATCCHDPPCVGVAIRQKRLTYENIEARGAFTLNVPAARDAAGVDYLGIVSGRKDPDKVARAGFEVAAGKVVDAPLLLGCPVNLECRVVERVPLGSHTWFVGQIFEAHVDEALLDDAGVVDVERLDPLVYCTSAQTYRHLGDEVGRAFHIGKSLKK